jgi:hypothetical protein
MRVCVCVCVFGGHDIRFFCRCHRGMCLRFCGVRVETQAAASLGLRQTCNLQKRAMQFGTRYAYMRWHMSRFCMSCGLTILRSCGRVVWAWFRIANKDVAGHIVLQQGTTVREIVNQISVRPLEAAPAGRRRVADRLSKITAKSNRSLDE